MPHRKGSSGLLLLFASLFFVSFFISGCGASMESLVSKADAPLMQAVNGAQDDQIIAVFVRTSELIDAGKRAEIESKGVLIRSLQSDLFTAEGSKSALMKLAELPFVSRMELPQTSLPK